MQSPNTETKETGYPIQQHRVIVTQDNKAGINTALNIVRITTEINTKLSFL